MIEPGLAVLILFTGFAISCLSGAWRHDRYRCVNRRLVISMGSAITAAALAGSVISRWVANEVLMVVFAGLAAIASPYRLPRGSAFWAGWSGRAAPSSSFRKIGLQAFGQRKEVVSHDGQCDRQPQMPPGAEYGTSEELPIGFPVSREDTLPDERAEEGEVVR